MIIISCTETQQDTTVVNADYQDSIRLKSDSVSTIKILPLKDSVSLKTSIIPKPTIFNFTDTSSVCFRNSIADITFYDSDNIVAISALDSYNWFPILFTEKNNQMQIEARRSLIKHLKPGEDLPAQPFHEDWIIGIVLIAAFLYSLIRTTSKSMLPGFSRFFLFRGINDPSSREIGGLFHWQSTLLNLISFLIIGLFAYCAAVYYNFIPPGISGLLFWLISFGIIISAVTLRHIVCLISGNISGEKEVFREYLLIVYQSYRFSALFLFLLVILMSYTVFFPAGVYLISGIIALGTIYLIRVIRLLLIFINRNISIFYLILYLCALEILPVVISVKYFTGLV